MEKNERREVYTYVGIVHPLTEYLFEFLIFLLKASRLYMMKNRSLSARGSLFRETTGST